MTGICCNEKFLPRSVLKHGPRQTLNMSLNLFSLDEVNGSTTFIAYPIVTQYFIHVKCIIRFSLSVLICDL